MYPSAVFLIPRLLRSIDTLIPEGTVTETTITLHFKNTENWSEVGLYMGQGGSWSAIPGYEQYGAWPGSVITAGDDGWYTVSVTKDMSALHFIYNNNNGGSQTENLLVEPKAASEEYWIVDGTVLDYMPTTIVMHYYAEDFSDAYAYFTETDSWTAIEGYESAGGWPGVTIKKDSKNANWYTFSIMISLIVSLIIIAENRPIISALYQRMKERSVGLLE